LVIKHVGPFSCAKIIAVLYAIFGLAVGAFIALVSLAGGFATAAFASNPSQRFFPFIGVAAVVLFPVMYATFGFVATLISAWLYNALARGVGGIEIDLE
jgi:hypothetical protein